MKDELKNISAQLAAEIVEKFQSPEVRSLIEQTKAASDGETGTFEVVITTENLDRYQEVIKLDGWDLAHYRNNPIVLWGHDHNQPIGMATSVEITDGKMIAKGKFAPTEKAQEVRRLYDFGIIKATSVGFIEKEREGNLITKAELLEFSFVSVPANPYALSLSMEKGLSVNELVTKGLMFVEKAVREGEETTEEVATPVIAEKGAIADEQEAQNAREQKWKNFSAVDDVICSFWKVYFDNETPVADFGKLLDETVELLRKVNGSEKAAPLGIIPVVHAAGRFFALEALGTKAVEPEGDEDEDEDEEGVAPTEEEKGITEYLGVKKDLQLVATVLGDVLAEMRQAEPRR